MLRIALFAFLVACKSKSEGALEKFATKYSCPEDQVTVKPRPDLDAADILMPDFSKEPSDEVKNDPARLAKFEADQEASRESWRRGYGGYDMFEVTGCGHEAIMGCHHPSTRRSNSTAGTVTCDWSPETKQRDKDERRKARAAKKNATD